MKLLLTVVALLVSVIAQESQYRQGYERVYLPSYGYSHGQKQQQIISQSQAQIQKPEFGPLTTSHDELPVPTEEDPDADGIVGVAGQDYPVFSYVPQTGFSCEGQYPGYYADVDSGCQVFHFCYEEGFQKSFLCPNGSIFNQKTFTCMWWYNVSCQDAPNFYQLNAQLYIIPEPKIITGQVHPAPESPPERHVFVSQPFRPNPVSPPRIPEPPILPPLRHHQVINPSPPKTAKKGIRYVLLKVPVSEDGIPQLGQFQKQASAITHKGYGGLPLVVVSHNSKGY
ncbi:uncharacterized protein LOC111085233 [Limulus polyphemus]|uniref:Uncharacterized protein LOC111085233 n=1 Tax=Limulus polyphemus TaxID=6850 RepID=A0ABM1S4N1_LIMPO|nr:uncharacterized protein LOC111085233 [Limulus polyphemus]